MALLRSPVLLLCPGLLLGPAACGGKDGASEETAAPTSLAAPWAQGGVQAELLPQVRGQQTRRGIVHLHSAWSHDACDGDPLPDGRPNAPCLQDLRDGLCAANIDVGWLTDHPTHAADQPYLDRMHLDESRDSWLEVDGQKIGARWACGDGRSVLLRPGYEDDLMPAGMMAPLDPDLAVESGLARGQDAQSFAAIAAAGALPLVAHTEGRDLASLVALVADGLAGVELFNLHAAFDPNIRRDDLGLEPLGWVDNLGIFTDPTSGAEPDLLVLTVFGEQTPSVQRWDALQAHGRIIGTLGTDAHQNVMPVELADGERGDSYRRSLRWMSQHLRVPAGADPDDPMVLQQALAQGRFAAVFEVLGTPASWDFRLETGDGSVVEPGDEGAAGVLVVDCPVLATGSPRAEEGPEIQATVFKDGSAWAEGCGEHPTDGPGAYRVRYDILPLHLAPFLGADPAPWMVWMPWIYTQHIAVR